MISSPPMIDPNTTPAGINPYDSNYKPNFSNPETRAPLAIAFCSLGLGVMTFFVSLRVYTKARIRKRFGWDDWTCVIAALLVATATCSVIAVLKMGAMGPHMWDIPLAKFTRSYNTALLVAMLLQPIYMFMIKLSLMLLYLEIFHPNQFTRMMIYAGIGFLATYYTAALVATSVLCMPRPGDGGRLYGDCSTKGVVQTTVSSGFNIATDLYILAIPITIVWKLKLSGKKRLGVTLIFLTGSLATVCSCIVVAYNVANIGSVDSSWTLVPPVISVAMESNIGVVCACLPCLPALWRHAVTEKHWSARELLSRTFHFFRTDRRRNPEHTLERFKGDFGGRSDESVLVTSFSFQYAGSTEMDNTTVHNPYVSQK